MGDPDLPSHSYLQTVDLHKQIAMLPRVVDTLWCPKAIVAIIQPVAKQRCTTRSNNILVKVVIGIAIAIVKSSVIIKMIMSGKIDPPAFGPYTIPKSVSIALIIIEAVRLPILKIPTLQPV